MFSQMLCERLVRVIQNAVADFGCSSSEAYSAMSAMVLCLYYQWKKSCWSVELSWLRNELTCEFICTLLH